MHFEPVRVGEGPGRALRRSAVVQLSLEKISHTHERRLSRPAGRRRASASAAFAAARTHTQTILHTGDLLVTKSALKAPYNVSVCV